ncbi:MAG TPA: nicotinate phosphoribosyltransferase, partial [Bryobacteraceae bacterium]|nr:nicotinate phosphoribosyltransferase [Bryobacteraceae bacterium]
MTTGGSISGLLTDLYELTMAAGYFAAGKSEEKATFELTIRRLPANRSFAIAAGLAQAVEYLTSVRFEDGDVRFLRSLPQFSRASEGFFDRLRRFRFTGDVFGMPEGTPVFAGEPVLTVRAPLIEAQIAETYLLATIGFQTMVATKAARVVQAAEGRAVVEFGTRRAHSPQAGLLAGRAAYIGGCLGTSNTLAGSRFGIPVFGTAGHSWVLAFPEEEEAFRRLQELLGEGTTYIVDTYDTLDGVRKAAALGSPLWGIRLDSGDLMELSRDARAILDAAGLTSAKVMATGDLNEYKIRALVEAGAPIDAFGVGTDLVTSADAPAMGVVYKLVELESNGTRRYTAKFSEDKRTYPGAKQVFRFLDHDEIACAWECGASSQPLIRPVLTDGDLAEPLPTAAEARAHAAASLAALPAACRRLAAPEPRRIEYSPALRDLAEE